MAQFIAGTSYAKPDVISRSNSAALGATWKKVVAEQDFPQLVIVHSSVMNNIFLAIGPSAPTGVAAVYAPRDTNQGYKFCLPSGEALWARSTSSSTRNNFNYHSYYLDDAESKERMIIPQMVESTR